MFSKVSVFGYFSDSPLSIGIFVFDLVIDRCSQHRIPGPRVLELKRSGQTSLPASEMSRHNRTAARGQPYTRTHPARAPLLFALSFFYFISGHGQIVSIEIATQEGVVSICYTSAYLR
jgi:hypothetical protein